MSYALAIQKTTYNILTGSGLLVYDSVPQNAEFPYVSFGPSDEVEVDADCIEAVTITQQIDVWSRKPGFVEAKQIASLIRDHLHRKDVLTDAKLVEMTVRSIRYLRDPDGLTSHAVISLESIVET